MNASEELALVTKGIDGLRSAWQEAAEHGDASRCESIDDEIARLDRTAERLRVQSAAESRAAQRESVIQSANRNVANTVANYQKRTDLHHAISLVEEAVAQVVTAFEQIQPTIIAVGLVKSESEFPDQELRDLYFETIRSGLADVAAPEGNQFAKRLLDAADSLRPWTDWKFEELLSIFKLK